MSGQRSIATSKRVSTSLASVGTMLVSVRDSGVGLSEDNLKQMFREGIQFNANQLQGGQGSGLGLWISKGFVDLHKGSLVASSEGIGRGSKFEMKLPVYLSTSAEAAYWQSLDDLESNSSTVIPIIKPDDLASTSKESQAPLWVSSKVAPLDTAPAALSSPLGKLTESRRAVSEVAAKLRILVVDDSVPNRKVVCRLLINAGFECAQAENGQECIDMVQQCGSSGELYDAILMDFEMPVLNGPLATEALRNLGYTLPIIGLTGNVLPADKAFFLDKGAQTVLTKPVKVAELKSVLTSFYPE